ncbi:hypothetical protein L798_08158 [Zootermopsis nevadensis]|uniref:Uncharacterized protein n=1 Tax=Zootermopsis nevadensis TaxID=136037 RepID=A0A067RDD0_ZOONE|nr:hypothetical protein L798_08158 [Zootermopsis nevadensis]
MRCEARIFRNKKREYLKGKIAVLETNNKEKKIRDLYRSISNFKKGYQPQTNLVKDDNGYFLADSIKIVNRWKNFFSELLNVHETGDIRQIKMHTAELLVPEPSLGEVELAIRKLKSYKSPGIDQIPAELIKASGKGLHMRIHKLIQLIWDK